MKEVADSVIAQWGAIGLLLVTLGYALLRSWKQSTDLQTKLDTEHAARLTDAKENTKALLAQSDQVHLTLDRLEDIAERLTEMNRKS